MYLLKTIAFVVGMASISAVYAAGPSKAASQTQGLALGNSALSTGRLTPSSSIQTGTATGANNPWGAAYTNTPDAALTGQQGEKSMIGIGNKARISAVSTFGGYNSNRDDQANQATYFLDRNPILKPTIALDDPILDTDYLNNDTGFASRPEKTCTTKTVTSYSNNKEVYSCNESFVPYVLTCGSTTQVSMIEATTCPPGVTCSETNTGTKSYGANFGSEIPEWSAKTSNIEIDIAGKPSGFKLIKYQADNFGQLWVNGNLIQENVLNGMTDMRNGQVFRGRISSNIGFYGVYFLNNGQTASDITCTQIAYDEYGSSYCGAVNVPSFYDDGCNNGCRGRTLDIDITRFMHKGTNTITMVCANAKGIGPCAFEIVGNSTVATYATTTTTNDCAALEGYAN